jgi:hypothetical protein
MFVLQLISLAWLAFATRRARALASDTGR